MTPLLELSAEQLRQWFVDRSLPGYRAGQVRKWLFQKRAAAFDAMTDLSATLREQLSTELQIWTTTIAKHHQAADGSEKLLLELHDGHCIECVLLRDDKQHCTVCISTQVGCAMGCAFCATGIDGVVRNLTTGEILEEILQLQRLIGPQERLSHIVVMGMGEPLLNLDALLPALDVAVSREGLGIGVRRVTISTVGIPAGIRRLANDNCQYHLAISLHAATDALRSELIPANRGVGVAAIMEAADEYFDVTGRRVTFEYVLLDRVNDQSEHARQLIQLLRGRPSLVNLIPYNPVAGLRFRTPSPDVTAKFVELLTQGGLNVVIRHRKGDKISAACGQLRRVADGEGLGIRD
jgi:23S rRNA (adenine2503-C2)-methyltransferase